MFQVLHVERGSEGDALGNPPALGDAIRYESHTLKRATPEGGYAATPIGILACDEEGMHKPVEAWCRRVRPIDSFLPTACVSFLCRLGRHIHVGRLVLAEGGRESLRKLWGESCRWDAH